MSDAALALLKITNSKIGKPLQLMVNPGAAAAPAGESGHAHAGHSH
jgi:hypothetical protein